MKGTTLALFSMLAASSGAFAAHGHHWGYSGAEGPEHWGELDQSFSVCRNGRNQSPVDLAEFVDARLPPIGFHYHPGGEMEENNGHSIQIDYAEGSTITLNGHDYALKQYHFHAPSENHVGGKEFPMEAHLVHVDESGRIAVVAVMIEEGAENAALTQAWSVMPEQPETMVHLAPLVSAEDLLPKSHDYYRFTGSLTTPPCTEGVAWLVMKEPVTASAEQIHKFASVMGHPNNRPIQATNHRVILK
ncbi:carbonic anhydrase [Imhoffiella purpurea]|uniref:Carbonic anhydrase n=1 Tax=Imhoffiella purpurea TaxID=1249627 RepID=W9VT92_9GAMM|nr:carbonic anhydrase family protein [Imhoffiella purpurea]EXJ13605.1 Carbonic anhydrase [Imhoffiella purpurea]